MRRRKRKGRPDDSKLTPEQRAALLRAFGRAARGCRLVWLSLGLYMLAMLLVIGFYFQAAFPALPPDATLVVAAGAVGAVSWLLGAVGVGLCLSGPPGPDHGKYGAAAAVATVVHLTLLLILALQGRDFSAARSVDPDGLAAKLGLLPTRLDALAYALAVLAYPDQDLLPKGTMGFSVVVGLVELVRTTLILMLLSCLASAAGDKDLAYRCTRAAGFSSIGPGLMALGLFLFAAVAAETQAGGGGFLRVIFTTLVMGTYAVLSGCVFPGLLAARDVAEACDEPFRSQLPDP